MAINRVEIEDFLVFKDAFTMDFCPGVNVLIGENGTGKTTVMKVMYAVCDNTVHAYTEIPVGRFNKSGSFEHYFYDGSVAMIIPDMESLFGFGRHLPCDKRCLIVYNGMTFGYRYPTIDEIGPSNMSDTNECTSTWYHIGEFLGESDGVDEPYIKSTFIPVDEALSHSKGFLALNIVRSMPFDQTFTDILSRAELPITRIVTPNAVKILDKIKKTIGGEVIYENDIFYVVKEHGDKIPFALEASGYRKLGLLWKLLRNGLLEADSILFWDEPENSLNPELMPVLVDILLELAENGVQLFLATHDYNLARHFDVRKNKAIPVLYHNLAKTDNGQIVCKSSAEYTELPDNSLERANEDLFEAVVSNAMGESDDV